MEQLVLREADRVTLTVLVDNYLDLFLLDSCAPMQRAPLPIDWRLTPVAEHGLSVLVDIDCGAATHTVLLDASPDAGYAAEQPAGLPAGPERA